MSMCVYIYLYMAVLTFIACLCVEQMAYLVVQKCADDGRSCEPCDHQNLACYRSVTFNTM
jgi:hypothetical protein